MFSNTEVRSYDHYINGSSVIVGQFSSSSCDDISMEWESYETDSSGYMSLGEDCWQGPETSLKTQSKNLCPYEDLGHCPWPCASTSCQCPGSCPMDWEPYSVDEKIDHDSMELDEEDKSLGASQSSYYSDESSGSVEFVGNLEYSMANDDNLSEGPRDMELERDDDQDDGDSFVSSVD